MAPAPVGSSLESALRIAGSSKAEERFLGVALALRHGGELTGDAACRARLLEAADAAFLQQLLCSQRAMRRIALAALRTLLADGEGALRLKSCAGPVVTAFEGSASTPGTDCDTSRGGGCAGSDRERVEGLEEPDHEKTEAPWGVDEFFEVVEVLRQFVHFLPPSDTLEVLSAADALVQLLAPSASVPALAGAVASATLGILEPVLKLVQDCASRSLPLPPSMVSLLADVCSEHKLRNSAPQALALGIFTELVEGGAAPPSSDAVLSDAFAAGTTQRPAAMRLLAAILNRHGLGFGLCTPGGEPQLNRLRALLELVAGELRLGLEGHASVESLCAACMALEAGAVAFGRASEDLESSGQLEVVSDCLRVLHRAVGQVHEFCADVPEAGDLPPELAVLARFAAAWQLEDPRTFAAEFSRSLPVFCRLAVAEFRVLLPCVQEMDDWHLTHALGKVLSCALESAADDGSSEPCEAWRQCALMLSEVALDAAAYLPDAPLPPTRMPAGPIRAGSRRVDDVGLADAVPASALTALYQRNNLPRPLQAADADHEGVQRLVSWSCNLWRVGSEGIAKQEPRLWELGILCGALLTSVPEDAIRHPAARAAANCSWDAVVACLLAGPSAEAPTWRLALRLGGFVLDRHSAFAAAWARAAQAKLAAGAAPRKLLLCPTGGWPDPEDTEDEWASVDCAAAKILQQHIDSVVSAGMVSMARSCEDRDPRSDALSELD